MRAYYAALLVCKEPAVLHTAGFDSRLQDVHCYDRRCYILKLKVPALARGTGVGTALLQRVIADAEAEGRDLWLEFHPHGGTTPEQLERFYRRAGFVFYDPPQCAVMVRKSRVNLL